MSLTYTLTGIALSSRISLTLFMLISSTRSSGNVIKQSYGEEHNSFLFNALKSSKVKVISSLGSSVMTVSPPVSVSTPDSKSTMSEKLASDCRVMCSRTSDDTLTVSLNCSVRIPKFISTLKYSNTGAFTSEVMFQTCKAAESGIAATGLPLMSLISSAVTEA